MAGPPAKRRASTGATVGSSARTCRPGAARARGAVPGRRRRRLAPRRGAHQAGAVSADPSPPGPRPPSGRIDPVRPADDEARALARRLMARADHGALGVLDPESGGPHVTRVAVGMAKDGAPLTLISSLSHHTAALRADPRCSLLLGEPGPRGDPLTHPRLTLIAEARFAPPGERADLREAWLARHPKARLYVDFADFAFARLVPSGRAPQRRVRAGPPARRRRPAALGPELGGVEDAHAVDHPAV